MRQIVTDDFQLLVDMIESARQLAGIANDWNLDEVEIFGEMRPTYLCKQGFYDTLKMIEDKYGIVPKNPYEDTNNDD